MPRSPLLMHFRLYVGAYQKSDWYNVFIFESKRYMYEFWQEQLRIEPHLAGVPALQKLDFLAMATHWTTTLVTKEKETRLPWSGQVLFYKGSVGAGIVSHEMTHLALYWHCRNTTDFNPTQNTHDDEKLAWLQGHLVSQFWKRFYSRERKGEQK